MENEQRIFPEQEAVEPTTTTLVEACRNTLTPENCKELGAMDFEDALGYAITLLEEQGIDWKTFLTEQGILEEE